MTQDDKNSLETIIESLKKFFDVSQTTNLLDTLDQLRMSGNVNFKMFGVKITRLLNRIYPNQEPVLLEQTKVNAFLRDIGDGEITRRLRPSKPSTLEYAINKSEVIAEDIKGLKAGSLNNVTVKETSERTILKLLSQIDERHKKAES